MRRDWGIGVSMLVLVLAAIGASLVIAAWVMDLIHAVLELVREASERGML